jgi:hypothetical protein
MSDQSTRQTLTLQELCRRERYHYEHVRRLAEAGRFPVVRLGRRLYVLESAFLEWARGGGMALPGGWRRTPKNEGKEIPGELRVTGEVQPLYPPSDHLSALRKEFEELRTGIEAQQERLRRLEKRFAEVQYELSRIPTEEEAQP